MKDYNMKNILLIFGMFCFSQAYSRNSDSLKIDRMNEQIVELGQVNKQLNIKIDTLNDANNKIISATYALLALIFGIGIWNTIQTYRLNNQKMKSIEDGLFKKINSIINEKFNKISLENKLEIEKFGNSYSRSVLEDKILLCKMRCQSIDVKYYKDINVEVFRLNDLLVLSKDYYKITGDIDVLKESLNHIEHYQKKYADPNGYEEYETNKLIETIKSVKSEKLQTLRDSILSNFNNN